MSEAQSFSQTTRVLDVWCNVTVLLSCMKTLSWGTDQKSPCGVVLPLWAALTYIELKYDSSYGLSPTPPHNYAPLTAKTCLAGLLAHPLKE